jgi:hypothetical protein
MVGALLLTLFFLLSLVILEILPLLSGSDDLIVMQQANFQLARNEFIAKDVLILEYKPNNRSQAISELQTVMPTFQQVQKGFLSGDITLGLPSNPPDNVRAALLASQSDYLAIVTAVNHLTAQTDSNPDPIQVNIVLQHERFYVTEMYQVITLLQQDAEARKVQLILIKLAVVGGAGVIVILKYTLFTRKALERMAETEESRETKEQLQ